MPNPVEPSPTANAQSGADAGTADALERLLRGGAWVIAGTVLTQICALGASVLVARLLGRVEFGKFGLLKSTFLMMSVFAGASLGLAASQRVAELHRVDRARTGRVISLLVSLSALAAGLVALAGAVFASPLASYIMGQPQLESALRPGCVYLAATVVAGVQNGALAGLERFPLLARLSVLDAVLQLAGVGLGARLAGVNGAVAGMAAAGCIMFLVRYQTLHRACHEGGIRLGFQRRTSNTDPSSANVQPSAAHAEGSTRDGNACDPKAQGTTPMTFLDCVRAEWPLLWHLALPSALMGLMVQPFEWWVRAKLSQGPGGFAEMGVFASAFSLSQVVQFLPQQLGQPALPVLTRELKQGDSAAARRLATRLGLIFGVSAALAALAVVLLAKPLLGLFGRDFVAGTGTLALLAGAYVLAALARLCSLVIMAGGSMWLQAGNSLVLSLMLAGSFALSPAQTAQSLGWCYLGAYAVFLGLQSMAARQVLRGIRKAVCE